MGRGVRRGVQSGAQMRQRGGGALAPENKCPSLSLTAGNRVFLHESVHVQLNPAPLFLVVVRVPLNTDTSPLLICNR
jgi:hypothetical protein